jgi:hypothetical protein
MVEKLVIFWTKHYLLKIAKSNKNKEINLNNYKERYQIHSKKSIIKLKVSLILQLFNYSSTKLLIR